MNKFRSWASAKLAPPDPLEKLIQKNLALGVKIENIRQERMILKQEIDEILAARAPQQEKK